MNSLNLRFYFITLLCVFAFVGCTDTSDKTLQQTVTNEEVVPEHISAASKACFTCHKEIVESFSQHGMSQSLGPAGEVSTGSVSNPYTGTEYALQKDGSKVILTGTDVNNVIRRQEIVGRLGAGIFDVSWVGAEIDPGTGLTSDRLFFTPVETVTSHGLELSPFELRKGSMGMSLSLTEGCLTCHTDDDLSKLPRASLDQNMTTVHPSHNLGVDAFDRLNPLNCSSCHGAVNDHLDLMNGLLGDEEQVDIEDLSARDPGFQVDVCARCHLQGDIRWDFIEGRPDPAHPIAGQIPVTLPTSSTDDFRFVGQVDRLAESACFTESDLITCTTCHDPHTSVKMQGLESFENTCISCHATLDDSHMGSVTVESVTGNPARSEEGCIDCHMRVSQPFDLPHINTTDHNIRRRITKPSTVEHRSFADSSGLVQIYDDGRLTPYLSQPGGSLWEDGVKAMSLASMGRFDEAQELYRQFPNPGTKAARTASAPEGLAPLETQVGFHILRARLYQNSRDLPNALAAINDAIALDPQRASSREERALIYMLMGDLRAAFIEADSVLAIQVNSEKAWNLRGAIALRQGFPDVALESFQKSTELWPIDPNPWFQLANLYESRGMKTLSDQAFQRYNALVPEAIPQEN